MKTWNEIRKSAAAFSRRWRDAYDEKSQAQNFLREFFEVFGVDAVTTATFEHRVKFADGAQGYADCFWQGRLLIEMKSRGKDLDAAFEQALSYVRALPDQSLIPRAIVVSDFRRIRFYDLTRDCAKTEFPLSDLRKYVTIFGVMLGEKENTVREQNPVNRKAAEQMALLHDALLKVGYTGHPLEVYLVRLLFCLFAEDTGIFMPHQFTSFVAATAADGYDLAPRLAELFQTLNSEKRLENLDETLAAFPYVNGGLFASPLPIAVFSAEMRKALLKCGELDWSKISPAIFGAMFQGVKDAKARRDLGEHYTSEENILKLIRPLFLDSLYDEFASIRAATGPTRRPRLEAFHDKLASLTFLDPACGCGNFLLVAYRELRRIEMDLLEELHGDNPTQFTDISLFCKLSVSQFHGIEIEPFPAEIAKVALWLMDHLCNLEVADRFGQYFARIPIKDSADILCANALTSDWPRTDFIMGNPPFIGSTYMSPEQKSDMLRLFPKNRNLDFVCAWYKKANDLIQGTATRCAFVSTNSITQGEQVAPLWQSLNATINFAYRTFKWHNEAKGNAAVHCVIIGFSARDSKNSRKTIFNGDKAIPASNINAYLMDAPDIIVASRATPLCDVPQMVYGNKPTDGGNLIFTPDEKEAFLAAEPQAAPLVRPLIGSEEFINGKTRYCLWLVNANPSLVNSCPMVKARIEAVRRMRLASKKAATRAKAKFAALFDEVRQPSEGDYIIVPCVSSERREYVPIGFLPHDVIVNNLVQIIPNANLYHFGILTSRMHNAWMRTVAGRLKSDYRYSKDIVYDNFVWPSLAEDDPLRARIVAAAHVILDIRDRYLTDPSCSLAILYNPETMPPDLTKAHAALDALVDRAYGIPPSADDDVRVARLFTLYAEAIVGKAGGRLID